MVLVLGSCYKVSSNSSIKVTMGSLQGLGLRNLSVPIAGSYSRHSDFLGIVKGALGNYLYCFGGFLIVIIVLIYTSNPILIDKALIPCSYIEPISGTSTP